MSRSRSLLTHERLLTASVIALVILALLPARLGWLIAPLGALPRMLVSPIQRATHWFGAAALGPARGMDDAERRALEAERDHWRSLFERMNERYAEAQNRLVTYEAGALTPEPGVRLPRAAVIGAAGPPGSHLLRLNAGSNDGVTRGTVAVVDNVQVVGRVEQVSARSCLLVLITQRGQPPIDGSIILDDSPEAGENRSVTCQLYGQGNGTLRGQVEYKSSAGWAAVKPLAIGQTVYLADKTWPSTSRMLVLGRVREIQTLAAAPLRPIVVVEPTIHSLDRLTEVVLRIPVEEGTAPGPGGGP